MNHFQEKKKTPQHVRAGFTLIELLIVVAIIAILAAIAVPNFLEAQVRGKVSRAKADMRSVVVAMEAYRTEFNKCPPPFCGNTTSAYWWGFAPSRLTTPVAYMSSLPTMPFIDSAVTGAWASWSGKSTGSAKTTQPYTYIYDTAIMIFDHYNEAVTGASMDYPGAASAGLPNPYKMSDAMDYFLKLKQSSFLLYTSGPDNRDGTVYVRPSSYDPSNGTVSFGDIHSFGTGTPDSCGKSVDRGNRPM